LYPYPDGCVAGLTGVKGLHDGVAKVDARGVLIVADFAGVDKLCKEKTAGPYAGGVYVVASLTDVEEPFVTGFL
jgi:hypothetical protein